MAERVRLAVLGTLLLLSILGGKAVATTGCFPCVEQCIATGGNWEDCEKTCPQPKHILRISL